MSGRWFRVAYARNAFRRVLAERELTLDALTPAQGAAAMVAFAAEHRPQHGVLDELVCEWAPADGGVEFSITRRLQREGQPEAPLRLSFLVAGSIDAAGEAAVSSVADIRATAGYRALGRARVVSRRLIQEPGTLA